MIRRTRQQSLVFRRITSADAGELVRFSCTGRSAKHGAQAVQREIRQGKSLRRVKMFPDDRFVGLFRRDTLVACGYHRHEPALDMKSGRAARYLLFVAVADTFQSKLLGRARVSDLMLGKIHTDIAHHKPATEIVAARAHPGHAASRDLLVRNGYEEVAETPPRRDTLFIAEL